MVVLVYLVVVMGFCIFDHFGFDSFCWAVAVGTVGCFGKYFDIVGCFDIAGCFDIDDCIDIDDCFDTGSVGRYFVFGSCHGCVSVGCSLYFVNVGADLAVGNVESCVRCQTI
jgi:hypothetical protein